MHKEFLVPLFHVGDLWYQHVQLLPLFLAAIVDRILFLLGQLVVFFSGNLEFEVNGDVSSGSGWIRQIGGWVVIIRYQISLFLFLPPGDDGVLEAQIPGVGTISLDGGKLPSLGLTRL